MRQFVSALPEIIHILVHHEGTPNHAVGAAQLHNMVSQIDDAAPLCIRFNIAEIANVTFLVTGSPVIFAVGIEVRASTGAAVGVITKRVDVKTMPTGREKTSDLSSDVDLFTLFGKADSPLGLARAGKNTDSVRESMPRMAWRTTPIRLKTPSMMRRFQQTRRW